MAHLAILAKRALTPTEEIHEAVVLIEGGQIVSASTRADSRVPPDARRIDAGDATIVPGFVDLHVHGAGGHDVMEATPSALETVSRALAHGGTTSFLATTVTADPERICKSVAGIATVIAAQAGALGRGIPRSEILGIHLEGPFISRVRRGVHPEPWIAQAAPGLLRRFLEAAQGKVRILTLAPELPGALELVDIARAAGLIVSLGHTDATYEQALAAIARGATHAAHVFNAMRPFSHRETGVIGAILTSPEVKAELIADGVHVDAAAMRVLLAAKGANGVDLVSDGTSATGMGDGCYRLGDFDVEVKGGVVRNREGKLAGSALTLDAALRNIVALGVPLVDAVRMLTLNPARELGMEKQKGAIAAGADADLMLLDPKLGISRVMTRGRWLDERD